MNIGAASRLIGQAATSPPVWYQQDCRDRQEPCQQELLLSICIGQGRKEEFQNVNF